MRKYLLLFVALFMLAAAIPGAARAEVNDTSVINSGDNAFVSSSATETTNINVQNTNTAFVNQEVNATANTGHNSADGNISLGGTAATINTGAAVVDASLSTVANSNTTAISLPSGLATSNTTDIVNTGDNATVHTNTTSQTNIGVYNDNFAQVNQSCGGGGSMLPVTGLFQVNGSHHSGCNANTGHNTADDNIGGASIQTGNATVLADFDTKVNKNQTYIGGYTGGAFGLVNNASILNTGDNASIFAHATRLTNLNVFNNNFASIWQNVNAKANTGWNFADDNIGGASIRTGNAVVGADLDVLANSNKTVIGGHGVFPLSLNLLDIVNTGDWLETHANTTTHTNVNALNSNTLFDWQRLWARDNSGWNFAHDNIGGASVHSGLSFTGASLNSVSNQNVTLLGGLLDLLFLGWLS